MASPSNRRDACADIGGLMVPAHIRHHYPTSCCILDVGAGWGKYRHLLPEYPMDACEVWEPYVVEEKLAELYERVFIEDICDLDFNWYDIIIFGDVFEHIDESRATEMLNRLSGKCTQLYIVVPYQYHQEAVNGNQYEEHKQEHLTDKIMQNNYKLTLLARDNDKGVYIK